MFFSSQTIHKLNKKIVIYCFLHKSILHNVNNILWPWYLEYKDWNHWNWNLTNKLLVSNNVLYCYVYVYALHLYSLFCPHSNNNKNCTWVFEYPIFPLCLCVRHQRPQTGRGIFHHLLPLSQAANKTPPPPNGMTEIQGEAGGDWQRMIQAHLGMRQGWCLSKISQLRPDSLNLMQAIDNCSNTQIFYQAYG